MKTVRRTVSFSGFMFGLVFFLVCTAQAAGEAPITQGEWAVYLARGLGLEKAMPEGSSADEYISVLGNNGYRRIEGEDYYKISPELSVVETDEFGISSAKKWLKANENPGMVRYRFEVPVDLKYTIRARNRGMIQFWTIDDKGSVMVSPEDNFKWMEIGEFDLKPGPHEITVTVPAGGGIDLIELLTGGAPSIEPPGGFNPLAPLTYGEKAETIVKALNLEGKLPIDSGFFLVLEAELYDRSNGRLQVSGDLKPGPSSKSRWVKPEGPARVFYTFEVPERGLYNIKSRGFGDRKEEWTFDLGAEKTIFTPASMNIFNWKPVTDVFLEPGPHTIEIVLKEGNGTDVLMIERHRAEAADYLQLLSDLGLQEGALPAKKNIVEGRRYQLYQAVEAEEFVEVKGEVERSTSNHHGTPSGLSWIKPGDGSAVCRYEIEIKEDGIYAIYMLAFGPDYFSWTIDPEGDSFLEKRDTFPASGGEFSWGEVVTLELSRGKHIFEVSIPASGGLDIFELRKRSWLQTDLDALAREYVSREEALRNLEEVEERGKDIVDEKADDEDPDPPDEPEPPDEYTPLSPFVP